MRRDTGDSAVGLIGRRPQRHTEFVESSKILRAYLRGESVRRGDIDSRLEWLERFDYIDAKFAAWFGIAGPASYAIERIHELVDFGFDYFFLPPITRGEREQMAAQVMPKIRGLR